MSGILQTDFDNLSDGDKIRLFPRAENPLHKRPTTATYQSGYFYCDGSPAVDGPDYYLGDVLRYCIGYTMISSEEVS